MTGRRAFLKAGIAGGLLLGAGGLWYSVTRERAPAGRLDRETRLLFAAIAPVILAGVLPPGRHGVDALVDEIETAFGGLSAGAQAELGDLFGLLALRPARWALAGIGDWQRASQTEIAEFLESWRHHRLALMRGAYAALHDLVLGTWYARPESWEAIGYPGPPELK